MKSHFLAIFSFIFLLVTYTAEGQRNGKKFKNEGVLHVQDSLTKYSQSDIFKFPNINKVLFYHDKAKLHRIIQLKDVGDDEQLYELLKEYVSNFGIENFSKSSNLIWQLARLSEKLGPAGEAILLYKLVLKHHQSNIDRQIVRKEYDTLMKDKKDYYVPLDYYYELVEYRKEIDTLRPPHGVLLNIGDWVNSEKEDYGPTIGNLDTVLLFTSKRNRHASNMEHRYDEDLFFTIKDQGTWLEAQEFKNINTSYNEGSACISNDGKTLFFARCNNPESLGNCDLYISHRQEDNTWGFARNLGAHINSTAWDSQPSLTHSGDTLFFASDRLGGFGMTDIYYTIKDANGNWSKAQNVGPIINTRGFEVSPFFHHAFNVLYFSSNGHPLNFGDFDIYKSHLDRGNWHEPKNVGPLVNGPGSEYYFTIDSQSKDLYYARSSEENITNLDIYSFPVPMEAQPNAIAHVKGSLINAETKNPMRGIVSIIDLDQGVEVAPKYLRPDGSFDFDLINHRNYLLIIQGDNYFRIEEVFYLDGDIVINKETEPIISKIAFESLEFENGKADILLDMHSDLDKVANFMIDHPWIELTISGHTDTQGNPNDNLTLSQARADAIKAYLIYEFKIAPDRIVAHGYGSTRPIVQEKSDNDRRLNRRVEFEIGKMKKKDF